MIYTTLDNFYLSDDALENSPSRRDGIDRDTENMLRMYGCELIQQAGIMLQYDQAVMATAQVLFHRFYCKRSMKNFNVKKVAATALWQGCKLEEVSDVQRHPGELLVKVMVAIDRCTARRDAPEARKLPILDVHSKEGEEFKRSLIRYELEMLKAFGFITHVEHPHKQMLNYCQALKLDQADLHLPVPEHYTSKASVFIQEVWNVANDSLRTTLCVRFRSSVVACGIIFYTARKLKVPLPEDPPWWELFGVKLPQICEVCRALHDLYRAPKPRFIPVCHTLLPSKPPTPQGGSAGGAPPSEPGATPDLDARPGGKPLDPSVRRAAGPGGATPAAATPGMAANGSVSAAGAASAGPSPVQPPAAAAAAGTPGSAPRKRPGSPRDSPDGPSKRQQRDGSVPDLAGPAAAAATAAAALTAASSSAGTQQQQQQQPAAAAGLPPAPKPRRSSHRSRSRSRSRERSKRHRSRSRSRDRDRDRGSKGGDKSSHRDGHGSSRSHHRHDRDRDRDRGKHHSREPGRGDKSSGGGGKDDKPPREQQQRPGSESTTPMKERDAGKQPQGAKPGDARSGAGGGGPAAAGQQFPPPPDGSQPAATNGPAAAAGEQKPPAAKPKPVAKKKVAPAAAAAAAAPAAAERQSSPGAGAGSSGGS